MSILEKMDQTIMTTDQEFDVLMAELSLLVEQLDCSYSRAFFWAARTMMESKETVDGKKEILQIYRSLYLILE